MNKKILSLFFAAFACSQSYAQSSFNTVAYVNKNNLNATVLVHGDMWLKPADSTAVCEFPKGFGINLGFRAGVWMSGNDAGNALHVSASTYREFGVDYWPGPYDINQDYNASQSWARIWQIDIADINTFLSSPNHTIFNTPQDILAWPAKGNPYAKGNNNVALSINTDMAPFVDVNNDGVYNALQGDYPLMKGDQMMWWVFTDNGPTHVASSGTPLDVEVHASAYAYRRWTLIDNVIYYQYDIVNKSANTYNNFRFGQFTDPNIGYAYDDFTGYDSVWRMGIGYNGKSVGGQGEVHDYGTEYPVMALTFVHVPGDNGTNYVPMGSYVPYDHNVSNIGDPTTAAEYDNYMRLKYRDGSSFASSQFLKEPFFECDSNHNPGDRLFILSTGDMNIAPGEIKTIVTALITTDTGQGNGCPHLTIDGIRRVADTAWGVYNNPPGAATGVGNVALANDINIYPNPFTDALNIQSACAGIYKVYNGLGQKIMSGKLNVGNNHLRMAENIMPGMYFIEITDVSGNVVKTKKIEKQ